MDYIRDILVSGTGMGRLCDASVIENWGKLILKKDIRPMPLEGRFDMVESKKGIVLLKSPVKWINRKAKFQTRENNSLSDEQRTHTVRFYGGFSYEMITAINSSVRDITSGETLPVPIVSQQEKASTIGKATRTSSDASFLATASQTVPFGSVSTFEVNGIHHNEIEDKKLVEYAALAESASSHPISKSLQRAYGKEPDRTRVSDIQEISGNGIIAKVDGVAVAAGNAKLMKHLNIQHTDCHQTGTIIHMAIDGKYAGHIVISDVVKPHSKDAISALKTSGVEKTVMLTGDAKKVADQVASSLGIAEVYSELLPADKVSKVEELLRVKRGKAKLAFVGDGINDAPVLSRADIGIAMGAMGSDAAIEAADIVLMDDDPMKISKAIRISGKCLRIVYQNITLALGVKFACLILGAVGIANMYLAIFADVGVMILAVLNAIRCLFVKKL